VRERVAKWYFLYYFYGSFKKWNPKWMAKFGKSAWLIADRDNSLLLNYIGLDFAIKLTYSVSRLMQNSLARNRPSLRELSFETFCETERSKIKTRFLCEFHTKKNLF